MTTSLDPASRTPSAYHIGVVDSRSYHDGSTGSAHVLVYIRFVGHTSGALASSTKTQAAHQTACGAKHTGTYCWPVRRRWSGPYLEAANYTNTTTLEDFEPSDNHNIANEPCVRFGKQPRVSFDRLYICCLQVRSQQEAHCRRETCTLTCPTDHQRAGKCVLT